MIRAAFLASCRWSFYANLAILGAVWACQILLWLFQVWLVEVRCLIRYRACSNAATATHCMVCSSGMGPDCIGGTTLPVCNMLHKVGHEWMCNVQCAQCAMRCLISDQATAPLAHPLIEFGNVRIVMLRAGASWGLHGKEGDCLA